MTTAFGTQTYDCKRLTRASLVVAQCTRKRTRVKHEQRCFNPNSPLMNAQTTHCVPNKETGGLTLWKQLRDRLLFVMYMRANFF